jgi:hypothetical protein
MGKNNIQVYNMNGNNNINNIINNNNSKNNINNNPNLIIKSTIHSANSIQHRTGVGNNNTNINNLNSLNNNTNNNNRPPSIKSIKSMKTYGISISNKTIESDLIMKKSNNIN